MDNLCVVVNNVVFKIILVLIMLFFILIGVGSYLIGGFNDFVVKVNG